MNATRTRSSSSSKSGDDQDRNESRAGTRGAKARRATRGAAKSRASTRSGGASKRSAAKTSSAKKSSAKKSSARKTSARKTSAKKAGAGKPGARKTAATRAPAKRGSAAKSRSRSPIGQAIDMLTEQHQEVQRMFRQGERLRNDADRLREVVQACCDALTMHADIEEQYFYPVMRENMRDAEAIDEARIEHESAKQLISQLQDGDAQDEQYAARFKVLGEYVKHHIKEEEQEIFPRAKRVRADWEPLVQALQASEQEQGAEAGAMQGAQAGGMQRGEATQRRGREGGKAQQRGRQGGEAQRRARDSGESAGSEGLVGGALLGGTQEGEEALRAESGRARGATRGRQGRGRSAGTAGAEGLDTGMEEGGNVRGREEADEQQPSRGARSGSH